MSIDAAQPETPTRASRVVCVRPPQSNRCSSDPGPMRSMLHLIGLLAVLAWLISSGIGGAADIEAGWSKAEVCTACHSLNGNFENPAFPALAGQPPLYTYYQLLQFRERQREDRRCRRLQRV